MKLAIVGSRSFDDYKLLQRTLKKYEPKVTHVISGGARGADSLAEKWAQENNKELTTFIPDWDTHGNSAAWKRNNKIVEAADGVIAFWDGKSKGTQHSFKICKRTNTPLKIVKI